MTSQTPTYEELMARKDVVFISEYEGYLYVALPARQYYDNCIWKVDKKTHEVYYMMFTEYLVNVDSKATYIVNPDWAD